MANATMNAMAGYAVLDLETTGFSPARGDRIVEIGLVRLDDTGTVTDEWETLVNPLRTVGATQVHHIHQEDIASAPTMSQLAPELVDLLRGRVVVAHNSSFDVGFLTAELRSAGMTIPPEPIPQVCTMRMSPKFLDARSKRLADCCEAAGVSLINAHSALGDARATAQLFDHYLALAGAQLPWRDVLVAADDYPWPSALVSGPPARLLARK